MGKFFGHYTAFIIGAVIAVIDHWFVYARNGFFNFKNFSLSRLMDVVKHEERYGVKSKSGLFHSLFGLGWMTGLVWLFFPLEALFFGIGYLTHLILDWPDKEEKQYLYPLKIKFKGFLPIWSYGEKIVTFLFVVVLVILST